MSYHFYYFPQLELAISYPKLMSIGKNPSSTSLLKAGIFRCLYHNFFLSGKNEGPLS